jgi:hypothetical protein
MTLLLLSLVCLSAVETIGTMQFDYILNKVSTGEVSRVFFASPSAPDVPLTSFAIDMFPENTEDLTAYSTPQLLLVQENNLSPSDYSRRVALTFTVFTRADGGDSSFRGDYAVVLWRFQNPQNPDLTQLRTPRDKGTTSVKKQNNFSWGLDNAGTTDGSSRLMYYALSFVFSGQSYISNANTPENLTHLDMYSPGSYSATITIELQGN